MLNLLWHGKEVPPATQHRNEHLPDPSKQPPFEKGKQYDSIELFRSIPHPASEKNPYIINDVPDALDLTPEERQALVTADPFFINVRLRNGSRLYREVNSNVASYAHKLEHDLKDNRYNAAEAATYNDSGIFALCAASAKTPEEQNKLFLLVADEIVATHMLNPDLLKYWMQGQFSDQGGGMYSQYVFYNYDMQRPAEERLFAEGPTPTEIMAKTYEKWTPIIYDLDGKIRLREPLSVLDLRHIEFLAHSIKVDKLLELIKSRSSN